MLVSMELSGPGLVPLDKAVQDNIVRAASAAWDGNLGMRNVRGVEFEGINPVSPLSAQAQAQGRALLQGTGAGAGPTFNISDSGWVSVQLAVDISAGQAPDAAQFVAESGYPGGALPAELANEGVRPQGQVYGRRWPSGWLACVCVLQTGRVCVRACVYVCSMLATPRRQYGRPMRPSVPSDLLTRRHGRRCVNHTSHI
jgi:hypothetical protein